MCILPWAEHFRTKRPFLFHLSHYAFLRWYGINGHFLKSEFIIREEVVNGKGSAQQYVILFLSIGRFGNINNTERMFHFDYWDHIMKDEHHC